MSNVFARRFRECREAAGLKQEEIGLKLGRSAAAISAYETGVRKPNSGFVLMAAEYFDVSCDWLLGRKGVIKSFEVLEDGDYRGLYLVEKQERQKWKEAFDMLQALLRAVAENGYNCAQAYLRATHGDSKGGTKHESI